MDKLCPECKNSLDSSAFGWKDNGLCNGCNSFKDSSGAGWEERWRELHSTVITKGDAIDLDAMEKRDIDFIRAEKEKSKEQAESSAYERVVEVLEGMRATEEKQGDMVVILSGYNLALSEAISKIKELEGKI